MIWALRDPLEKFNFSRHHSHEIVIEKYLRDILRILNANYLMRVCRDIETDLRLSIHLDLKSDESRLFKEGLKDLSKFINIPPIVIYDKFIDTKSIYKIMIIYLIAIKTRHQKSYLFFFLKSKLMSRNTWIAPSTI
jgi:TATA-binding protein-associated factor Taf7